MILEHQADMLAHIGNLAGTQLGQVLAVDDNAAGGGPLNAGDQFEQGGLARAGVAGEKDHFSGVDVEGQVFRASLPPG